MPQTNDVVTGDLTHLSKPAEFGTRQELRAVTSLARLYRDRATRVPPRDVS